MQQYLKSIEQFEPIHLTIYDDLKVMSDLEFIIETVLKKTQKTEIKGALVYCIREMLFNARKANIKRVFFKQKGIDIEDLQSYQWEIANFKESYLSNVAFYKSLLESYDYSIDIVVGYDYKNIFFKITNKFNLHKIESQRINEKMNIFGNLSKYKTFSMASIIDETEGAGIGILMILLTLKRIGIGSEYFSIEAGKNRVESKLTIPLNKIDASELKKLYTSIINKVEVLPHLPEHIIEIQKLLENKEVKIADIAEMIKQDPGLTSDLLKLVNSAMFSLPNRVGVISKAITIIGLKELNSLIISYGVYKTLSSKYSILIKELWSHATKVAFYAKTLGKMHKAKVKQETCFLCGLLHDFGKIIIYSASGELLHLINTYCMENQLSSGFLEYLVISTTHAKIGAKIFDKWNFPEEIIHTIAFHHEPEDCKEEFQSTVYIVYLADKMVNYEQNLNLYPKIPTRVLNFFNIKNEKTFNQLRERIEQEYIKRSNVFSSN